MKKFYIKPEAQETFKKLYKKSFRFNFEADRNIYYRKMQHLTILIIPAKNWVIVKTKNTFQIKPKFKSVTAGSIKKLINYGLVEIKEELKQ